MSAIHEFTVFLTLLNFGVSPGAAGETDLPRLREMLRDRQHPRQQSQAALLLVQQSGPEAEAIIRQALRQLDAPETVLALAEALRFCQDGRFLDELLAALAGGTPAIRHAAAEALAAVPANTLVVRLQVLVDDSHADLAVRQAALLALGRSGHKQAALVLVDQLTSDQEALRRAAANALTDLTGQTYGGDLDKWRKWWESHKDLSNEQWLSERLAYQAARSWRLEGDLDRARSQIVRLHQQLYARLPPADRLGHIQSLVDAEDATVRGLAVAWGVELLATIDALGQKALADVLIRLSWDGNAEVQRQAVLGLGRVSDGRSFDRLRIMLRQGHPPVRAAAARALAQQARGSGPEANALKLQVVPLLQKALDDPALEVVVEAAEDLGTLGLPEASPVLIGLLLHPSEPVRQAAALALERVADVAVLDSLLDLLDDPAAKIRFSIVGALGHAAGDGRGLTTAQRDRLLTRLESLLVRDADAGVRSRAATVLGECGPPAVLSTLWKRVLASEDSRVQEKAWLAFVEVLARSGSVELVKEWDRSLAEAKQMTRRLLLLTELHARWQKRPDSNDLLPPLLDVLIPTQLDQGKWVAAFPLVREQLSRPGTDADLDRKLRWLLTIGEQALKEGNRMEAERALQQAQPFLARRPAWTPAFQKLDRPARTGP